MTTERQVRLLLSNHHMRNSCTAVLLCTHLIGQCI